MDGDALVLTNSKLVPILEELISRDLKALRDGQPDTPLPLRSTVHDIGPVLTHRVRIVQLALAGKTTTQICRITKHSPAAVVNYLSTFERCVQLAGRSMQAGQIAFLLRRGKGLIQKYLQLLTECESDIDEFLVRIQDLLIDRLGAFSEEQQRFPDISFGRTYVNLTLRPLDLEEGAPLQAEDHAFAAAVDGLID